MVTDPDTRRAILTELTRSVQDNEELGTIACFWPRHGVRWHDRGDYLEMVICFECSQLTLNSPGGSKHENMHFDTAAPLLDNVLRKAGIKLAPKPGENEANHDD
jgi:hypothetical protein